MSVLSVEHTGLTLHKFQILSRLYNKMYPTLIYTQDRKIDIVYTANNSGYDIMTQKTAESKLPIIAQVFNGILIVVTMILGVVAFFSLLDIVIMVSLPLVVQSAEPTIQQNYMISTIRNFYLFIGGCFLLGFLIISMDYHTKRLSKRRTTRILVQTLVIELIIIGIDLII
jgi:hypothetical protein